MSQTKRGSAIESAASTAIGFLIAYAATLTILPLFGHTVSAANGLGITCFFTVISFGRGYAVRRLFVWLHKRGWLA